jgi:hypothetical protein
MLSTKPPDLAAGRPDLAPAAAALIMRCIASDATQRPATAAEVAEAWAGSDA